MNKRARRQRGHLALLLALSIVVAVSVVSVGVVEVGLGDSRRIADELRRTEAQSAAEEALDRAALWLSRNATRIRGVGPGDWMEAGRERWQVCDDNPGRPPCSPGDAAEQESFDSSWSWYGPIPSLFDPTEPSAQRSTAYYLARGEHSGAAMPGWSTLHVIAQGRSRDGTGLARMRRGFQLRPLFRRIPEAPLIVAGAVDLGTNVSVLAPDGVPAQIVGSGVDPLSTLVGATDPRVLRAAAQTYEHCDSLGPASRGLIWIGGECLLPAAGTIGSVEAPVALVLEAGAARIEAPTEFFGIIVLRSRPGVATTLHQTGGPATLHGALLADGDLAIVADGLSIQYESAAFSALLELAAPLSEIPGSWTDHR